MCLIESMRKEDVSWWKAELAPVRGLFIPTPKSSRTKTLSSRWKNKSWTRRWMLGDTEWSNKSGRTKTAGRTSFSWRAKSIVIVSLRSGRTNDVLE